MSENVKFKVETAKKTQEEIDAYRAENLKRIKKERRNKGIMMTMWVLTIVFIAIAWILRSL